MIDRLSNTISIALHLAIIVLLGKITFAVEPVEIRQTGMEIEIIDLEHAMPNTRPVAAEAAAPSSPASEPAPTTPPNPAIRAAPSRPAVADVPAKAAISEPVVEKPAPTPQPAPQPIPAPVPKAEPPAQAASASPGSQAKAKAESVARLDASTLARSRSIAASGPAAQSRLNSATIGSAIGKAAPRGLPGLTFRQKVDLAQKVREQVMPCWNPPAADGGDFASVRLRFRLDRAGRVIGQPVQSGSVGQTSTNAAYVNLLTNSGRRAVMLCAPLKLPPELYEAWAEVEVEFDPRELR